MTRNSSIAILGGNGALGSAIATALLARGVVEAGALWISSRSGTAGPLTGTGVRTTSQAQEAACACGTVILAVPPAQAGALGIAAADALVISVMAGVPRSRLAALAGAGRVVRAMSSPAAATHRAFSPWFAPDLGAADKARTDRILSACGLADEVTEEAHIDLFTGITGPIPGFVAYLAQCFADHATARGVAPDVANRAARQLFLASGEALAASDLPPAAHVQAMIDYAGTTAAGLRAMQASPLAAAIAEGVEAAVARAQQMGRG
ncbi:pyrroline-5-carboxylate reductase family protein [Roseisalinus antarcticus]|uniref:Pyrroline-5-carboxylate reductase n=1 Tax=Roseisalinus antarcticus TaxID=254357 RepID=A0A1Y5SNA9_9RHOB|nr:pyrroline-5-carboxylate reductase dimerization domain-containing protein [Roseisalinus antarcticus]SLN42969.1 Pyrroline-5-carboxylate reductase [Roseisalinus antarcticus]